MKPLSHKHQRVLFDQPKNTFESSIKPNETVPDLEYFWGLEISNTGIKSFDQASLQIIIIRIIQAFK